MPQMSPLMWGIMFTIFSFLMLLSAVKFFYSYSHSLNQVDVNSSSQSNINPSNWMW